MTNLPAARTATEHDLPALRSLARAALVHDSDAEDVFDLLWSQTAGHPQLRVLAEPLRKSGYGEYLLDVLAEVEEA